MGAARHALGSSTAPTKAGWRLCARFVLELLAMHEAGWRRGFNIEIVRCQEEIISVTGAKYCQKPTKTYGRLYFGWIVR